MLSKRLPFTEACRSPVGLSLHDLGWPLGNPVMLGLGQRPQMKFVDPCRPIPVGKRTWCCSSTKATAEVTARRGSSGVLFLDNRSKSILW